MFEHSTTQVISHVSSLGVDVIVPLSCFVLLLAWGLAKGKAALLALVVSLYPAGLIARTFPYYSDQFTVGGFSLSPAHERLGIFVLAALIGTLVIRPFVDGRFPSTGFWRFMESFALAAGVTGLTIAFLYYSVGIEVIYNPGPHIDFLFQGSLPFFLWLIGPLIAIVLFVRR